jgi:hypothetical protein
LTDEKVRLYKIGYTPIIYDVLYDTMAAAQKGTKT